MLGIRRAEVLKQNHLDTHIHRHSNDVQFVRRIARCEELERAHDMRNEAFERACDVEVGLPV